MREKASKKRVGKEATERRKTRRNPIRCREPCQGREGGEITSVMKLRRSLPRPCAATRRSNDAVKSCDYQLRAK